MTACLNEAVNLYRGVLVCSLVGMAAIALSSYYAMPVMILAMLLGLSLSFLSSVAPLAPGIKWSAKFLLYAAVALLGLRMDVSGPMMSKGLFPAFAIGLLVLTLLAGCAIGRILKIDRNFSLLLAGATAICGVSAAAVISTMLPDDGRREARLAVTIAGITVLSTVAILTYPALVSSLSLSDLQSGLFLGGTIHNVSQAVGAGYSVSEEVGNLTTIVKLIRVTALLPVVFCVAVIIGRANDAKPGPGAYFPPFLVAFFFLAGIKYMDILPPQAASLGKDASELLLIVSLAAIGINTNAREILKVGWAPFLTLALTTVFMAAAAIIIIFAASIA